MAVLNAGHSVAFKDQEWGGAYYLDPLPLLDSARLMTSRLYKNGNFICLSFHWSKTLSIGQGGCILHDDAEADEFLRRCRFDGRREGVHPSEDTFDIVGQHCYLSPRDAAEGLTRLALLPEHNEPLPNDDYPDLSKAEIFK